MTGRALLIVDVQYDFLPGGALPVPEGGEVIPAIRRRIAAVPYDLIVASQDWHPADHCSFVERGGPWPAHCVAGSRGARLQCYVRDLEPIRVRKGTDARREAYSAFDGLLAPGLPLREYLYRQDIEALDIVGLALDVCVHATARDAARSFDTTVILDACRAVDPDAAPRVRQELAAWGVAAA